MSSIYFPKPKGLNQSKFSGNIKFQDLIFEYDFVTETTQWTCLHGEYEVQL